MNKYFTRLFLFLLLSTAGLHSVFAQTNQAAGAKTNGRWTLDLNYGIPVTFFSVKSKTVAIYGLGVGYAITPTITYSLRYEAFGFNNKNLNPVGGTLSANPMSKYDIVNYNNEFQSISGFLNFDLHKVLGLTDPSNRWMPFASVGLGYVFRPSLKADYIDGTSNNQTSNNSYKWRDYQLGLGMRYYLNPKIDLVLASEFNYVETYWFDGAWGDQKRDNFLNTYLCARVKFGGTRTHNSLEWKFKDINEEEPVSYDYSRLSADFNAGNPMLIGSSIGFKPNIGAGLSARYSFTPVFSLQANYGTGIWSGQHGAPGDPSQSSTAPINIHDYKTTYNSVGLRALYNLSQLMQTPSRRRNWNHYVSFGVNYLGYRTDLRASNLSTSSFEYKKLKTQSMVIGYQARKRLSAEWDFIAGMDFNYNDTRWLDGAISKDIDYGIYPFAGISYKIGAKNGKELIDWTSEDYGMTKGKKAIQIEQVPIIEKPVAKEEPKIETPEATTPPVKVEPQVEQPKPVETPITPPTVTPKPAKPVAAPKPRITPSASEPTKPSRQPQAAGQSTEETPSDYQPSDEIAPPPAEYSVIVGCYSANKESIARKAKKRLERKGYKPSLYRDSNNSRMIRLSIVSTENKKEAVQNARRARKDIDPGSWIHLYNKQ